MDAAVRVTALMGYDLLACIENARGAEVFVGGASSIESKRRLNPTFRGAA